MERFLQLYQLVYQDLYRMACFYLGDPQEAEDAVGEAVLAAYESFEGLKNEASFRAWIFQILINKCRRRMRSYYHKKEQLREEDWIYEPDLSDGLLTAELLSSLTEEERRIVVLAVFGGFKGEEIAQILHKNHSTVRSKYRRALKKLEKRFGLREEVKKSDEKK